MSHLKSASKQIRCSQVAEPKNLAFYVKICRVIFDFAEDAHVSAAQLRGFLGYVFIDDAEFHHHSDKAYHYPLIQYKNVAGSLCVLGLQNYAALLAKKIAAVDVISTPQSTLHVRCKRIRIQIEEIVQKFCYYEFITPWLALNEINYSLFRTLDKRKRRKFLERILVANVLSCLKGLGIHVNFRIKANIYQYKALRVKVHDNLFVGFLLRFRLNILLPDLIGLGKSVSKGYGTIRRVDV